MSAKKDRKDEGERERSREKIKKLNPEPIE